MTGRAYEVLDEHEQDSPEWHRARRNHLGASEVAAVLGLSKWTTPLDVYRAKKGVPHEIEPDRAYFGHALEPVIAGWVVHAHRAEVGFLGSGFAAQSIEWPWLSASPDRLATAPDHLGPLPVELKSSDAWAKGDWSDGVPAGYQAQVQAQLAVLGAPRGWLAVLHGGNRPELHPIERDEEFIRDYLVPATRTFWRDHVLADVPPEPTSLAEAASLWPGDRDLPPVEADDDVLALWRELRRQKDLEKASGRAADAVQLELEKVLGQATELVHGGQTLATWRPQAGARRLDTTALRRDHPDLADAYTVQSDPQRRFLIKTPKEVLA